MDKIIFVDCDDVIADFVHEWLRLYRADCDIKGKEDDVYKSDIKSWEISKYVKAGKDIYKYISQPSTYNLVKPVDMSLWGVTNLRKMGYRVVFATSCPIGLNGVKFEWLNKNKFDVRMKDYIEINDKSLLRGDVIIDDNPDNVLSFDGLAIMFSQPWNENVNYAYHPVGWINTIKLLKEINLGR